MSVYYRPRPGDGATEFYRCDHCGTEANHLSDSWSEITVASLDAQELDQPPEAILHVCLECRRNTQEWSPDVQ